MISTYFVLAVSVLYVGACVAYIREGQGGSALMYFSYALANVGFLWQIGVLK